MTTARHQRPHRAQAIGLADATIDWFKTVTKDLTQQGKATKGSSTPTEAMALGFDAVGRAVREQQDRLLSGEVTAAVDGQSALIARLAGATEEPHGAGPPLSRPLRCSSSSTRASGTTVS